MKGKRSSENLNRAFRRPYYLRIQKCSSSPEPLQLSNLTRSFKISSKNRSSEKQKTAPAPSFFIETQAAFTLSLCQQTWLFRSLSVKQPQKRAFAPSFYHKLSVRICLQPCPVSSTTNGTPLTPNCCIRLAPSAMRCLASYSVA